jgi:hypothetical protein
MRQCGLPDDAGCANADAFAAEELGDPARAIVDALFFDRKSGHHGGEHDRAFAQFAGDPRTLDTVLGSVFVNAREVDLLSPVDALVQFGARPGAPADDVALAREVAAAFAAEGAPPDGPGELVHGRGTALFGRFCMFNHSCVPTAGPDLVDEADGARKPSLAARGAECTVRAYRDIKCGEEVFISYIDPDTVGGTEARREELLHGYGFRCTCPKCELG